MKLFRAVPRATAPTPDTAHTRQTSQTSQTSLRAPSNVPYLVDNLWEALRPDNMPSRRHAAYASPTPELALPNASALGQRLPGQSPGGVEILEKRQTTPCDVSAGELFFELAPTRRITSLR